MREENSGVRELDRTRIQRNTHTIIIYTYHIRTITARNYHSHAPLWFILHCYAPLLTNRNWFMAMSYTLSFK